MQTVPHLSAAELLRVLRQDSQDANLDECFNHLAGCGECRQNLLLVSCEPSMVDRLQGHKETQTHRIAHDLTGSVERVVERVIKSDRIFDQQTITARSDTVHLVDFHPPTGPAATWRLPLRVGRYELSQELGRGGEAIVFRARDTVLDREVAMKVPLGTHDDTAEVTSRFHQGAKAAAVLDHANICPIYHVDQHGDVTFLIMPVVNGMVLRDLIVSQGKVEPLKAVRIVAKVARALEYSHQRNVTHRDLKPANIILDVSGEPKIMDFGLARREEATPDRLTIAGSVMGTPYYMSPEQARGEVEAIGPATDIYALGVILFELLSGQKPFKGILSNVLYQINTSPTPRLGDVSPNIHPRLREICFRAMQRDPKNRHRSAGELAHELEDFLKAARDTPTVSMPSDQSSLTPIPTVPEWHASAPATIGLQRSRFKYLIFGGALAISSAIFFAYLFSTGWFARNNATVTQTPIAHGAKRLNGNPITTEKSEVPAGKFARSGQPSAVDQPVLDRVALQIDLQRATEKSGYRPLDDTVLPIRDNDKVQIIAKLTSPAYLYLYWYDARGRAKRLWPENLATQEPILEAASPPVAIEPKEQQRWHVIGGETGREMALAAVSDVPLTEAGLKEFERVRFHMVERESLSGKLVAVTRELVGTVESPKGKQASTDPGTGEAAALVLPPGSDRRLIIITRSQLKRALIGTVESLKGTPRPDLLDPKTTSITKLLDFDALLRSHFEDYYGLVFAHES